MLSSRAVATTDGTTSLHSPLLVVVFADAAGLGEGDEHALASTIRPTSGTRENRERERRTAADYTPHRFVPDRLVRPFSLPLRSSSSPPWALFQPHSQTCLDRRTEGSPDPSVTSAWHACGVRVIRR